MVKWPRMKEIKIVVFGAIIILLVEAFYFFGNDPKSYVLGEKETATESPIATPTETPTIEPTASPTLEPTITPKPTPKVTATPTPTPIPQPTYTSQQINEFIDRFASQYSVSPDILRYIALCESGFNSNATNLGYVGLYQFSATTWKNVRIKMGEDPEIGLRANAEEAVQTAAYNLHINNAGIWPNCIPT